MPDIGHLLRLFARDRAGNIALTAALSLPAMLLAGATALEMSQAMGYQSKLQSLADSAAIAAAREMRLGNATPEIVVGVARANAAAAAAGIGIAYVFAGEVGSDKRTITVTLNADVPSIIGVAAGLVSPSVSASATARVMGGAPVCAVALNTTDNDAIYLEKQARVEAPKCAVYSNSRNPRGIEAKDSATLNATFTCSAGGYKGQSGSFTPTPDTDCPQFPDPLASRPAPTYGSCDPAKQNLSISGTGVYLTPGVYCGGFRIAHDTIVTLQPGIYIIKNGPIIMEQNARLQGTDVGLYFTGENAGLDIKKETSLSLAAPRTGEMAGLLIYQDRSVARDDVKFEISSDDASVLLGTIYLPRGHLFMGGDKPVANKSAYTIVIANKIQASAGPTLVLNSDYSASEVPVPRGVGPLSNEIALQR